MGSVPRELAPAWTVKGYMNMAPCCRGGECNPYLFPVTMSDGSQRTVCLDHLPELSFPRACRIVAGDEEMIPMEDALREIDRSLRFLTPVLRDMVLENACRIIREGRVRA